MHPNIVNLLLRGVFFAGRQVVIDVGGIPRIVALLRGCWCFETDKLNSEEEEEEEEEVCEEQAVLAIKVLSGIKKKEEEEEEE
jgi:hypothetical protein